MDWTLPWCLKDQANGHLRAFMGLLFYQKLSQDIVKLVTEISDFFSINMLKGGRLVLIFISV